MVKPVYAGSADTLAMGWAEVQTALYPEEPNVRCMLDVFTLNTVGFCASVFNYTWHFLIYFITFCFTDIQKS